MTQLTQGKKLLEQMRDQIRVKQYSIRTEKRLSGFGWGNSKKVIWTNDDLSLRAAFFAAKQSCGG